MLKDLSLSLSLSLFLSEPYLNLYFHFINCTWSGGSEALLGSWCAHVGRGATKPDLATLLDLSGSEVSSL
jgi:hypothetical protein